MDQRDSGRGKSEFVADRLPSSAPTPVHATNCIQKHKAHLHSHHVSVLGLEKCVRPERRRLRWQIVYLLLDERERLTRRRRRF